MHVQRLKCIFLQLKELVEKVAEMVKDESLTTTMVSYSEAIASVLIEFKMCVTGNAFRLTIKGYEKVNFGLPLLDFAFITFPFMYNFKDSCSLIEEGN